MNTKHNIFLDCGSHHLEGLVHFLNQGIIDETFEIHTFEGNPECRVADRLKTLKYDLANCTFHQKLVWISDDIIAFNQENHKNSWPGSPDDGTSDIDGWASSIAGIGFVYPGYEAPIMCESIDFSRFIGELPQDSNIVCKLDIEGSEFAVLRKLLHDGTINRISKLYVEFHERFMDNESTESTNELRLQVQKLGIEINPWS